MFDGSILFWEATGAEVLILSSVYQSKPPLMKKREVDWNEKLVGSLPAMLGKLSVLEHITGSGNHLIGRIPASMGSLSNLQGIDLNFNALQGSIPTAVARWISTWKQLGVLPSQMPRVLKVWFFDCVCVCMCVCECMSLSPSPNQTRQTPKRLVEC